MIKITQKLMIGQVTITKGDYRVLPKVLKDSDTLGVYVKAGYVVGVEEKDLTKAQTDYTALKLKDVKTLEKIKVSTITPENMVAVEKEIETGIKEVPAKAVKTVKVPEGKLQA